MDHKPICIQSPAQTLVLLLFSSVTTNTSHRAPTAPNPSPTTTTTMAAASLSRLSRRAAAPSLRCLLSATASAPSPAAAPPPLPPPSAAAAASAGADRVRWDYRGQRQLVPLGQWMPKVAVDAYVAPEAVLAGQVTVHDGASVWSGAVLRGDLNKITLGFCANVQERCVLHAAWSAPTDVLVSIGPLENLACLIVL
ncbi:hypothetical protein E2562_028331 [Oryza meyeriana var. granulata]|uniref:Uncharacterized protein n=1 Tax=Oryza meyeriana var. granulata TaxID=110450 RepID=A0A6G1FD07_9ORYZ|nr:hypothetical protein E2562_028331 [Oryza meyeriana var. granulata]KAF0934741.1 hypothetical protein E2562_028331 [Oryza meyeriana var. granulata]